MRWLMVWAFRLKKFSEAMKRFESVALDTTEDERFAILEVSETLQEHVNTTFPTGVTHDAAHGPTSLSIHRWDPLG